MYVDIEKLIKNKAPIYFTDHAFQRMHPYNLTEESAKSMIYMSTKEKIDATLKREKKEKHKAKTETYYRRYNNFVFVIEIASNALRIITVISQNLDYPDFLKPLTTDEKHLY